MKINVRDRMRVAAPTVRWYPAAWYSSGYSSMSRSLQIGPLIALSWPVGNVIKVNATQHCVCGTKQFRTTACSVTQE
ncbi:hypothetical protein [Xanthomonas maliensis]|uniref:hypothetical protein n=1 Tax=Xanthomonas maliensis TaxID=1321368 RepID=UPI0012656D5A|nr:hypothetical protein [Xanthomonas maliensis]